MIEQPDKEKPRDVCSDPRTRVGWDGEKPTPMNSILWERMLQDAKWGGPEHDDQHDSLDWLTFIQTQKDKLLDLQDGQMPDPTEYRDRLVKIAALALAAIESYDRKNK